MQTSKDITSVVSHISYNMHPRDLPDISTLTLGYCVPLGVMRIYQANHSCPCYTHIIMIIYIYIYIYTYILYICIYNIVCVRVRVCVRACVTNKLLL